MRRAALVIDIREGEQLAQFPALFEAAAAQTSGSAGFSRGRRRARSRADSARPAARIRSAPRPIIQKPADERELLAPIRSVADHIIETSKFNVHELREVIGEKFSGGRNESSIRIDITQFRLPARCSAG